MRNLFVGFTLIFIPAISSAGTPHKTAIGTFSNKQFHPEEGDCLGREVTLWKEAAALHGHLIPFEGNCDEAGVELINIQFDSKTGQLNFEAPGPTEQSLWVFAGRLESSRLVGTLDLVDKKDRKPSPNREEVVLKKIRKKKR